MSPWSSGLGAKDPSCLSVGFKPARCFWAEQPEDKTKGNNAPIEPNYAVAFFSPSDPESIANLRLLNALAELSSGRLNLMVRPARLNQASDTLLLDWVTYAF